ncbi:dTDP-4-dehydrorhamnose 3,5-epimerase family protein [Alphaproteobacteria bacterium]|nr:dTDP-4-dehydrorhamnose 3,5-epimerase family protein [Alphaproteobacteria bacterium]
MIKETALSGVIEITPPTIYEDFRGSYVEIYNEIIYNEAGIKAKFIQDDISTSSKGVLRGIHGDSETIKLVTCLVGAFYLIVVNNDPLSAEYKKWVSFHMSGENRKQILIPAKFGNGHLVLTDTAIFHYKQTTEYNREGQFTIAWNDPEYDFWWPIKNPTTSRRDEGC